MQTSRLCWVALAAMVCAGAGPQEKLQLNTITKVEVRGNSIEIIGDRKPNFTTFSMTDPPRLVVDFSEAIFVGVSEELRGNGGLVAGIKTASYGSDASAIARVVIGFARNVDTDIAIGSGDKLRTGRSGEPQGFPGQEAGRRRRCRCSFHRPQHRICTACRPGGQVETRS